MQLKQGNSMEFEIIKEKENPLFGRKEIQISVETQVTPSRNEIKDLIAKEFSTQSENISLKGIHGKFGSKIFMINANIYSSKQDRDKIEPKNKKEEKNAEANTSENKIINQNSQDNVSENNESSSQVNNKKNPEPSGEANQTENA